MVVGTLFSGISGEQDHGIHSRARTRRTARFVRPNGRNTKLYSVPFAAAEVRQSAASQQQQQSMPPSPMVQWASVIRTSIVSRQPVVPHHKITILEPRFPTKEIRHNIRYVLVYFPIHISRCKVRFTVYTCEAADDRSNV